MNKNASEPSVRAQIIERRTYLRPKDDEGTIFETFEESIDRVIAHQRWLWERAKGFMSHDENGDWVMVPLNAEEEHELSQLRLLMLDRKVTVSGRTSWLGGTEVAKRREASQFNCAFLEIRSVYDVVDALWLLLQGCGVGFRPVVGGLNGFAYPIDELEIIRSEITPEEFNSGKRGNEENVETFDHGTGVWTLQVGDSAEAWAKSIGKIITNKRPVTKLVLDFSQIRPAGIRLKGYGWISSGDENIAKAYEAVFKILNERAGQLLCKLDILDLLNHLGTILTTRRSAEICVLQVGEDEWYAFAVAKKDYYSRGLKHRAESNNTIMFTDKPDREQLQAIFDLMMDAGGSEPGFANMKAAVKRAPWFKGPNPCFEILLGDRSFCNLVETVLWRFNDNLPGLLNAHYLIARANYRQTCVYLDDGILQRSWHELNEFLRLCGAGVTGVVAWDGQDDVEQWQMLRAIAQQGAEGMAEELGMPKPKLVTTIKPSGTKSKTLSTVERECPEGIHAPLGRYILNNVKFSNDDPLVPLLKEANYRVFNNPFDDTAVIITLPADFGDLPQFKEVNGVPVNLESAVSQLERYKFVMEHYVDHNCSITVSYSPEEVPEMIDWFMDNWDHYVAVSFLFRNDPTKSAEDLGFPYLPQEVVDKATFDAYVQQLKPVDLDATAQTDLEIEDYDASCATGACPVR